MNCRCKIKSKAAILSKFLLIMLFITFLTACSEEVKVDDAEKIANQFFELIEEHKFSKAYELLSSDSKANISPAKFEKRYATIFRDLKIGSVDFVHTQTVQVVDEFIYEYNVKYTSSIFNELSEQNSINIVVEDRKPKIKWTPAQFFSDMTWGDSIRIAKTKPKRGDIVAGNEIIATNKPGITIYAQPDKIEDFNAFSNKIAPFLHMTVDDVNEKFNNLKRTVIITASSVNLRSEPSTESNILATFSRGNTLELTNNNPIAATNTDNTDKDQYFYKVKTDEDIEGYVFADYTAVKYSIDTIILSQFPEKLANDNDLASINQIEGAGINTTDMCYYRDYPMGSAFFHIAGYVRKITEAQLGSELAGVQPNEDASFKVGEAPYNVPENDYNENSIVGQIGIERQYETELRGADGIDIYISDAYGVKKRNLYSQPAQDGLDIHLTIDPELQKRTYDMMDLLFSKDQSGATIVTNPLTGAVLSMVSYPSLDPNTFETMDNSQWSYINLEDPTRPFLNRATNGRYIPGSIFKPFTAALAMEQQKINKNTVFPYQDEIIEDQWIPSHINWTATPITRVENKGSECNFDNALVYSDNIFFAWSAMEVGEEAFLKYCSKIGFNEQIPFELRSEKSSIINTPSDFNIEFLAASGYGQGELEVTPLHMAALYGAFANDGNVMQPYLVESINMPSQITDTTVIKTAPVIWKAGLIEPSILNSITDPMERVMTYGTGNKVNSEFSLAGKTGTAEKKKDVTDISWLISYKNQNPKDYLVLVTIETPVKKGDVRNDITSSLMKYYSLKSQGHDEGSVR